MKTIISHLSALPEPYRNQAIANANKTILDKKVYSINAAIGLAFIWQSSPEGYDYWEQLFNTL